MIEILRALAVSVAVMGGALVGWAVIVLPVVYLVTMDEQQPGEAGAEAR